MRTRSIYREGRVIAVYKDDQLVYSDPQFCESSPSKLQIIRDIEPYRSMIDGAIITSRSRHREHLQSHGCTEVGNETQYLKQKPITTPPGLKETIARVAYEKLRY